MNNSNMSQFTDHEIKEQLNMLGFKNIPKDKFELFKKDLEKLIQSESSMNNSTQSFVDIEPQLSSRGHFENDFLNRKKVTFPYEKTLSTSSAKNNLQNQQENDENTENDTSFVSVTSSVVDNKIIKRKVLRKTKPIQKSVENLEILTNNFKQMNFENDNTLDEVTLDESKNQSLVEDDYSENQYYSDEEQTIKMNDAYPSVNYPVKSFIRSRSALSLRSCDSNYSKPSLKANPVKKYQEYQKMWNKHKVPGEKNRNDLRWSIREQMLQKDVVVKKQHKSYQPNTYAVPSLKKRQHLRWLVRSAMANPVDVL